MQYYTSYASRLQWLLYNCAYVGQHAKEIYIDRAANTAFAEHYRSSIYVSILELYRAGLDLPLVLTVLPTNSKPLTTTACLFIRYIAVNHHPAKVLL